MRDFARRNEIDNKYLIDEANFIISKMYFNSENNFDKNRRTGPDQRSLEKPDAPLSPEQADRQGGLGI